jgi:hypothetical protein
VWKLFTSEDAFENITAEFSLVLFKNRSHAAGLVEGIDYFFGAGVGLLFRLGL